jgi:hypothetical protein
MPIMSVCADCVRQDAVAEASYGRFMLCDEEGWIDPVCGRSPAFANITSERGSVRHVMLSGCVVIGMLRS